MKNENVKEIHLGSQLDKVLFYEKCGFVKYGDIFDDCGVPHIYMKFVTN